MTDTVVLTPYEVDMAGKVGFNRHAKQLERGRSTSRWREDAWSIDIEGACAELAYAKLMGVYWDGSVDTFKSQGDVGNIEVRSARRETDSLIIRPNDDPYSVYVLMIGTIPNFKCAGGLVGMDARKDEFLRGARDKGRPEAWFVPQEELKDIGELI